MANPRHREWITRSAPHLLACEACGREQYTHDITQKRVGGVRTLLCTTCSGTLRHEGERGLKAYVRLRGYYGEDVNVEVLERL